MIMYLAAKIKIKYLPWEDISHIPPPRFSMPPNFTDNDFETVDYLLHPLPFDGNFTIISDFVESL